MLTNSYKILLQIVRPNPLPDGFISSLSPTFPKNLNNLFKSSSFIPIPESTTYTSILVYESVL